ncbi:NtaA/DmoA family FMN-dependent monooxygenase [Kribbella turkmenica]|uniref:NtaA/DmoA family FMN-dependent monooxygenase n=1 Tax=Kribbella turkmenica TaxID=2530375 RepID=UPI00140437A2|nr:NtaA/DmoA family FMN-dependent monooxygenase [Kribbella turkmenica]
MTRHLLLGAFEVNALNISSQGLWARPDHDSTEYKHLSRWTRLAQMLDRGGFDFLFLADTYGYPLLSGEVPAVAIEQAVDLPKNDPLLLIPALAAVTERLSFAVTSSTTYEEPFANARRFATLDHLTGGRVAWNVVTSSSVAATQLFGRDGLIAHDQRYEIASEYMDLSYKLLEGSWEDDAVKADKVGRVYADPDKVHVVEHEGKYFKCKGVFCCEPSPQRTPVIFQAGASKAGRGFAARHAEVVFLQGSDTESLRNQVTSIRQAAEEHGRDPRDIKTVVGLSAIAADSRAEAEAQLEDYLSYAHQQAARVYYAMMTGVDLAKLEADGAMSELRTELGQTQLERYAKKSAADAYADFSKRGLREFIMLGTGGEIAEQLAELVEETDVDGINFAPFANPGSYENFIDRVVPELRDLELLPTEPSGPKTFREGLFGQAHAKKTHPAAQYRVGK